MIEVENSQLVLECKAVYDDLIAAYGSTNDQVVISRFGSFSQDLINRLSDSVEEILLSFGEKKTLVKRMFTILIEGLQNIKIHGELDGNNQQIGFLILTKNPECYKIRFANLIDTEAQEGLQYQISQLNVLDDLEVKTLYVNTLSNGIISQKGGAGLGFITLRLRSKSALISEYKQVSEDKVLFSVEVKIDKEI